MNPHKVIVDTGPLVAFFNKRDRYHEWVMTQFAAVRPPLLTCEAVLTETCFLLRQFTNGVGDVIKLLERSLIVTPFVLQDELSAVKQLLDRYRDRPMSLADGCLVRMSEQISDSIIFTLDRDFEIYQKNRRKVIPVIRPEVK